MKKKLGMKLINIGKILTLDKIKGEKWKEEKQLGNFLKIFV